MRIKVKVTEEHISNGTPKVAAYCPIALALKDQGYPDCRVFEDEVNLNAWHGSVTWLPAVACEFVRKFDREMPVKPIEFDLDFYQK